MAQKAIWVGLLTSHTRIQSENSIHRQANAAYKNTTRTAPFFDSSLPVELSGV
jgi:hypothetical protein